MGVSFDSNMSFKTLLKEGDKYSIIGGTERRCYIFLATCLQFRYAVATKVARIVAWCNVPWIEHALQRFVAVTVAQSRPDFYSSQHRIAATKKFATYVHQVQGMLH